jgi:hypothetical protein
VSPYQGRLGHYIEAREPRAALVWRGQGGQDADRGGLAEAVDILAMRVSKGLAAKRRAGAKAWAVPELAAGAVWRASWQLAWAAELSGRKYRCGR